MICPHCNSEKSYVTDSRAGEMHVRRRRRCEAGHRFTTAEIVVPEQRHNVAELAARLATMSDRDLRLVLKLIHRLDDPWGDDEFPERAEAA